jgi:hypothetical protein
LHAMHAWGDALVDLGDLGGARTRAEEMLGVALQAGAVHSEVGAKSLLAIVACREGRIAEGLRLADDGIERAEAFSSPSTQSHFRVFRGDLHLAGGDLSAADADYADAIAIARSAAHPHAAILGLLGRARVAVGRGAAGRRHGARCRPRYRSRPVRTITRGSV